MYRTHHVMSHRLFIIKHCQTIHYSCFILYYSVYIFANSCTFIPVSYTHLDVYKRQDSASVHASLLLVTQFITKRIYQVVSLFTVSARGNVPCFLSFHPSYKLITYLLYTWICLSVPEYLHTIIRICMLFVCTLIWDWSLLITLGKCLTCSVVSSFVLH